MPDILSTDLLMCPACGRLLRQVDFSLEHIIPQQALADDPAAVRQHKDASANVRGGNLLLCTKALKCNGGTIYGNGCNSWKGKWYDGRIRETLNGSLLAKRQRKVGGHHIIAMLVAGYLAMVLKYGYSAILIQSGLIMRQQFFLPGRFHPDIPIMCQVLMSGSPPPFNSDNIQSWTKPFYFEIDSIYRICRVGFKHTIMMLPITVDPESVRSGHLLVIPTKYALRPRFDAFFN